MPATIIEKLTKQLATVEKHHKKAVEKLTKASQAALLVPELTLAANASAAEIAALKAMLDAGTNGKAVPVQTTEYLGKKAS